MKKTATVTITNLYDPAKSMKVKNFSDENVKEVIGKLMDIKPKDLQCEASSMGGGIYSVKKPYRGLKQELQPIQGLRNQGGEVLIQVKYGDIYE
jgi:hypothetical protein